MKGPLAHQMLQLAKLQSSPDVIYISIKAEEHWVAACRLSAAGASGSGGEAEQQEAGGGAAVGAAQQEAAGSFLVRKERSSVFGYEKASAFRFHSDLFLCLD